ncbi:hypothetical protein OpiT1DRAFT_03020 [Opitutaceae bacterium TAV1]|nr:hypothetical protein OpiT1DRAFT_03020 [Opitutaceae bacterium TAV1]
MISKIRQPRVLNSPDPMYKKYPHLLRSGKRSPEFGQGKPLKYAKERQMTGPCRRTGKKTGYGRILYQSPKAFGFLHQGRKERKGLPVAFFASFAALV